LDALLEATGIQIDMADSEGRTPLSFASSGTCPRAIEILIAAKASLSRVDNKGKTPLAWAAEDGQGKNCEALLEANANVAVRDANELTPLNAAAKGGHIKACQVLLKAKSDVSGVDSLGNSSLLSAVEYQHADVVTLLLSQKADPHQANAVGLKPLAYSRKLRDRAVANAFKLADSETDNDDAPSPKSLKAKKYMTPQEKAREASAEDMEEALEDAHCHKPPSLETEQPEAVKLR